MSYSDKYQKEAISGSMMEAADTCGFKHRVLYQERAEIESQYSIVLDASTLGTLIHSITELYPTECTADPVTAVLNRTAEWMLPGDVEPVLRMYLNAVATTQADGAAKGRVYVAPMMTSFWKRNYSELEERMKELDERIMQLDGLYDIEPMAFLCRAIACVENYTRLLPDITAGLQHKASESTFHVLYRGEALAGTIDRLDYDPVKRGYIISDYKTGSKVYTPDVLWNLNQLNLYTLALHRQGKRVVGTRIISIERKEIIEAPFNHAAHQVYLNDRLPRLLMNIKHLRQLSREELPVLAGRSFSVGCPCVLATLPKDDPNRCPAVFV